ncbi:ligase-associated DNA damage response endonuclease PdeM [Sediminibacterium soli]|uniref:ligase-associated DNA damage response endonuclease PdeM n=1 Tax=Sediminibacterium soli TaxID=2698829 RepID=UPI001379E10B|nr:ligase-associated DNA damage response endonuclease PdeM [Sediminibacterium soli]NCI48118.1 ligase-associated DNA damage response endonuclease PdeM [Sediminibacterium soli]
MHSLIKHAIHEQTFWLSPQRCIYWEEQSALILSDLHLGKTGHFRKHGIAVPQKVFTEDLQRLVDQISYFKPRQVIAVGDLFHSHANRELDLFLKWRSDFASVDFILVKGNHDILEDEWYANAGIKVHHGQWQLGNIHFVHDPSDMQEEATYVFAGHLHPGVYFSGMGKQSLRFPCFHFSSNHAVLPAFSKFSGLSGIRAKKSDAVFAIVDGKLMSV